MKFNEYKKMVTISFVILVFVIVFIYISTKNKVHFEVVEEKSMPNVVKNILESYYYCDSIEFNETATIALKDNYDENTKENINSKLDKAQKMADLQKEYDIRCSKNMIVYKEKNEVYIVITRGIVSSSAHQIEIKKVKKDKNELTVYAKFIFNKECINIPNAVTSTILLKTNLQEIPKSVRLQETH
ncbi:hypothetical protein FQB35_04765 [Crassaminicella thermophila]|uniref:Uncharacterized protein n=1 Tax=Crassaminicella thermophila TaxID=2599308 RepID=A0A5C0SC85_CRATE|nr:hypothetical protein [Crassaminicella thermophila]QEK11730.1 hypothetical protein FQB35_04765 [Crassaminicella thermophila]